MYTHGLEQRQKEQQHPPTFDAGPPNHKEIDKRRAMHVCMYAQQRNIRRDVSKPAQQ